MIEPTVLTSNSSITDTNSYNTASVSPGAGRLILACVANNDASGGPDTPTVSGASMTWTQAATQTMGQRRVTVFHSYSTSPGSGALTISFGSTQNDCLWTVIEWRGLKTTGTNGADAIIQSAGNTVTGTTLTVTLSSFAHQKNATFGFMYLNDIFGVNVSPGSGFTELVDHVGSAHTINAEWKNSNDTSVDWTNTNSKDMVGLALELRHQPDQAGFLLNMT